jgi:hypothetical protein
MRIDAMQGSMIRAFALGAVAAMTLLSSPARARADFVTYSTPGGSTVNSKAVSSSVTLTTLGGGQLSISLTNSLATPNPAQVLTDILFNITPNGGQVQPTLSLSAASAGAGSATFTNSSTSFTLFDLTPGYRVTNTPGTVLGFSYQHGLGSAGEGGIFGGLGNESYGLVGPGTDLTQANFGNKFPLVMSLSSSPTTATFVLNGFGGFTASQITSLSFSYGSSPDAVIQGINPSAAVPEPAAVVSTLSGLAIAGLGAWRRRRSS